MNPIELVERYFTSIRSRDIDGLLALYADDATFVMPDGRAFAGIAAIREMQLRVFAAQAPTPTLLAVVYGQSLAAAEIEVCLPDGAMRHTANFFHLDGNGRIQRLSVYRQSQ